MDPILRLLEEPALVAAVRSLDARALGQLIDQVGLEDAGALVSLASSAQLQRIFDEDLFASDNFDGERFAMWLEVMMMEMGPEEVARRIVEMDEDFVALGLAECVMVLDMDELIAEAGPELDKLLEGRASQEIDRFLVCTRDNLAWNAIVNLFLALDSRHRQYLEMVLGRLSRLSADWDRLESDVTFERDKRRAREGYVSKEDARAFLEGARLHPDEPDYIAKMHLRDVVEVAPIAQAPGASKLMQMLPRSAGSADDSFAPIRDELAEIKRVDEKRYVALMKEVSFLANALVAERKLRPVEAAELAVATCVVGMQETGKGLAEAGAIALFRVGWHLRNA